MAYLAYISRDNAIDLVFKQDDYAINHASISKVDLIFTATDIQKTDVTISSSISPEYFTFASDKVTIKMVDNALVSAGNYKVSVVIYDNVNTSGIVWGLPLYITVKDV